MDTKNKTLEERVKLLEESSKPKFKSFFDNNLREGNSDIVSLKRENELLKSRVKLLEQQKLDTRLKQVEEKLK